MEETLHSLCSSNSSRDGKIHRFVMRVVISTVEAMVQKFREAKVESHHLSDTSSAAVRTLLH